MNDGYRQLSASEIRDLLQELLDRASADGIEIDAYLVGGAAMALQLGRDQLTPDVDGLFRPFDEVVRIGRLMAEEHGLSPTFKSSRSFAPREALSHPPLGSSKALQEPRDAQAATTALAR